jgi:hypothetical protein
MITEIGCGAIARCFRARPQPKLEKRLLLCRIRAGRATFDLKTAFQRARLGLIKYNIEKGGLVGSPLKKSVVSGVLMAGSSRTTFAKRQKERQRQEKQAEKAQRKLQRKAQDQEQDPNAPEKPKDLTVTYNEEGIPEGFGFHDF